MAAHPLTAVTSPPLHWPSSDLGLELSFPWATSSRCAAVAERTRALVALAIFLAASKICSSKFRSSLACWWREQVHKKEKEKDVEDCIIAVQDGFSEPHTHDDVPSKQYRHVHVHAHLTHSSCPRLQLSQLLGRSFNGGGSLEQFSLCDHIRVLSVHPVRYKECDGNTKQHVKATYYSNILQQHITATYYSNILQQHITATYYSNILQQ